MAWRNRSTPCALAALTLILAATPAFAQKQYDPGVSDTEIKIGSSLTYNTSDPTIDSQVVSLKASGADVFFIVTVPKFSAQAIRKAYDIDWHPQEFVVSVGSSIARAIRPAGFEATKGIISRPIKRTRPTRSGEATRQCRASHLDLELPLLLPGIRLKTNSTDLRPIKHMRLVRFDGERYVLFGDGLASE